MKIKALIPGHFGKFHNQRIELASGINVIYGANEAGKSTLHAFVRAMLFGIEKRRGREAKDDLYMHYLPWDTPGAYQGSMEVEVGEKEYVVTRNFLAKEQSVTVIDRVTGREVPPEAVLSFLAGGEDIYRNTVGMEQQRYMTEREFAAKVQNFIANLSMARSSEVNIAGAVLHLKEKQKDFEKALQKVQEKEQEQIRREAELREKIEKERILIKRCEMIDGKLFELRSAHADILLQDESLVMEGNGLWQERAKLLEKETRMETELQKRHCTGQMGLILAVAAVLAVVIAAAGLRSEKMPAVGILVGAVVMAAGGFLARHKKRECMHVLQNLWDEMEEKLAALTEEQQKHEQKIKEYGQLQSEREHILWEMESFAGAQTELDEVRLAGEALQNEKQEIMQEIQALKLATETIRGLSAQIHDSFGVQLNRSISQKTAAITDGAYTEVVLDEQLNVKVRGTTGYQPLMRLSAGTAAQIYLAVRVALSELMFPEESVPLVLDEAFAFYDEERLAAVLNFLAGVDRQVILFACRRQEIRQLEKLGIRHKVVKIAGNCETVKL